MNDLTIDVQVLMISSGLSDNNTTRRYYKDTVDLINTLAKKGNDFFLVMDSKDKIKRQYLKKMRGSFGEQWIMMMANRDKIIIVPHENLKHSNRKTFVKLKKTGFISHKGEDLKYVETAVKTNCNIIVTYDPHFYQNARILKQLPVHIQECNDCLC